MVKITEKGQVTLPKRIRDELDLNPGDEIDFEIVNEETRELKVNKAPSLGDLYGVLSTDKTFPGKDELRNSVGKDIGEHVDPESNA